MKFWSQFTFVRSIELENWLTAGAVAVAAFVLMHALIAWARRRIARLAEAGKSDRPYAEVLAATLGRTSMVAVALTAILIGLTVLDLPTPWDLRVRNLWFITLGTQLVLYVDHAVSVTSRRYFRTHAKAPDAPATVAHTLLNWAMKTVLWTVFLLAVLANLGINISAFVASLGIGGVAVALAVQNILGDLFASLSIAVDKPFEVGDAIVVNGVSGAVEKVGLKTTRIRADSGEQVVIANADLLKNTVRNYKRMANRRVAFPLLLDPATPVAVAREIPARMKEIVERQESVRFDRAHLKNVTQDALEFEVVYFVLVPSYGTFMDTQQQVLLGALELMEELGVGNVRPVQRVAVDMARGLHVVGEEDQDSEAGNEPAPAARLGVRTV
ncbi:mechanosensitive ion channel family protein [Pseudoduganella plicata]|uniref:Mechanosensitive ion channel family protein n=1 Tax=Pseudoduganella plicata TaxID=321984 RepID=A0A4P7BB86_9BURK|nr:mechanosensitive ion channel family protein [Pseudoduganella plicata]QBQ35390.1 mechanosensitive ion channel family protein [Pseudoduganella plicata]GGZ01352.1 mechanosensitive ion channel protein MscS [Pseudoduganella plicata]